MSSNNNKNNDMAAAIPPSSNLSSSSSKLSLTENQQQNNIPSIITTSNSPILKKSALKLPSTNPTRRKSTTEDDVLRSPRKVSFFHSLKYHYTPHEESLNGHHLPPKIEQIYHGIEDEENEKMDGEGEKPPSMAAVEVDEIPLKPDSIAFARSQRRHESQKALRERRQRRSKCIRLMGPLVFFWNNRGRKRKD